MGLVACLRHMALSNPRDQNSPKAVYSMVFGPKSLNI